MLMLFMSLVSAISTSPSSVLLTDSNTNQLIEFTGLNGTMSLTLSSSISGYTDLNFYDVNPSERWVTISLKSNVPAGNYVGSIDYSGGSVPIAISIASEEEFTGECVIDIFPTILTNVKVEQGAKKTRTIQLSVPSCYDSYVTVSGVTLQTDEKPIELGEISIGKVLPGSSISIPIEINGEDVTSGQYSDTLQFLVYDSGGNKINVPSVSISVSVTQGIQPVTSDTFSTPPSCALSATTLNLNNTYSFTCSGLVANLDVDPEYSEYYIGQNVDTSTNLYRYDFVPQKYGNTVFRAIFKYDGDPIFQAFEQEIRITSSGASNPGTDLNFYFTPKLENAKAGEKIIIQLIDNSSGSLVDSPRILVDAKDLNDTGGNFEFLFEPEVEYEVRGKAPGYDDIIQTIKVTPKEINLIINPPLGDTSTYFNITASVSNATIKIGTQTYTDSYYGILPAGINVVTVSKEGYNDNSINVTVDDNARIVFGGSDFKKGEEQSLTLNKNVSWVIFYDKSLDSDIEDRETVLTGSGSQIVFTPEKNGIYHISVDGLIISSYEAEGFKLTKKWWILPIWGWLLIGVFVVLIIIVLIMRGPKSPAPTEEGLSFQVGDG